jgi:hypothetical protein
MMFELFAVAHEEESLSVHGGRLNGVHSWIKRAREAREPGVVIGAEDHRRTGHGHLAAEPQGPVACVGRQLRPHPRRHNTTIYSDNDRYRGVKGTRQVVLMNREDIDRLGLSEGDHVTATSAADDGVTREVAGLIVTRYDIPPGCCGGYFPECNPLIPLWHHADRSKVPAAKSVPIRIRKQ